VQVQLGALERVIEIRNVVEEKAGARGMRLDDQRPVLEGVEVLFDLLVAGLGLEPDGGQGARHGNLGPLALLAGHQPFHVPRLGGLDLVARGGKKENARIAQADGTVAVVGHDQAHRHYAVAEVIDAEDGRFGFRIVGFRGDGKLLVVMHLDGGKGRSRLHRRRSVVAGHGRQSQPQQERRDCPQVPHRA
jgi:hypothetical protein